MNNIVNRLIWREGMLLNSGINIISYREKEMLGFSPLKLNHREQEPQALLLNIEK